MEEPHHGDSKAGSHGARGRWRLVIGLLGALLVVAIAVVGQASTPHSQPGGGVRTGPPPSAPSHASPNAERPVIPVPAASDAGPGLTISAPSLVFDQGATVVPFTTSAGSVSWMAVDESNHLMGSGTAAGGSGSIDLHTLGPGYYTLAVSVGPESARTTRVTGLAVLAPLPANARGPDAPFGIGMHPTSPAYAGTIPLAAQVGFSRARFDMKWDAVEQSPGSYTFPPSDDDTVAAFERSGITPLPIIDYSNPLYDGGQTPSSPAGFAAMGAYANAVLDHYGLPAIQVYNEPNLTVHNNSACGVGPECYLPMLQETYPRVKAGHPGAQVVGVGVPGLPMDWINSLFDLGALNSLDVVSLHPYMYPSVPEGLLQWLPEFRQSVRDHNGGHDKPFWITELGWPTHQGGGTSEAQQADYVDRAEAIGFANGAAQFYWYDLIDDGTDPANREDRFGLMRQPAPGVQALGPKPALVAQAVMIRQLAGRAFAGADALPEPTYSMRFGTGADTTRVLWTLQPRTVMLAANGPVTVVDEFGRSTQLSPLDGTVRLTATEHPVFVSGPVSEVQPR